MTQEEIIEFNKRCVAFLGNKITHNNGTAKVSHYYVNNESYLDYMLQFHSDWNWIIMVVETIEKLGFNTDSYSPIDVENDLYEFNIWDKINPEIEGRGKSRKESYIDAINQFLIWYEQNKQM